MAPSSVSSRTFSMADFEGSMGGGLTSVGWSAMVDVDGDVWYPEQVCNKSDI